MLRFLVLIAAIPTLLAAAPKLKGPRILPAQAQTEGKSPIFLDPGHGGKDDGAHSLEKPVYHEKNLTLTTTKLVETYLQQLKLSVLLSRDKDVYLTLDDRTTLAEKKQAKLFVSIHFNAALSTSAHGIEVFYYKSDKDADRSKKSKLLADDVLKEVLSSTQAKSRGVKHGNYAVIRESKMPAILIEGGFMTNSDEMEKMKDPQYLKKIAWGIAKGIENYLKR